MRDKERERVPVNEFQLYSNSIPVSQKLNKENSKDRNAKSFSEPRVGRKVIQA
jgi:hypothetical protein